MTSTKSAIHHYQQTQFTTSDRGHILLLMFDGGLRFLGLARRGLEQGDLAQFGHNLGRAQAVIAELLHTLDHKAGGEIASNLERLYRFMLGRLTEANLTKNAQYIADVVRVLDTIAGAYREIIEQKVPQVDAA